MKLSCSINLLLAVLAAAPAWAGPDSAAFFYGRKVPASLYSSEWLITDPRNLETPALRLKGQKLICYASAGEFFQAEVKDLPGSGRWALGGNPAWKTAVGDLRLAEYRAYLSDKVLKPAAACDGFFIDTIDSYTPFVQEKDRPAYAAAAAGFLENLKKSWPDKLLVLNRGFEILPLVKPGTVDAVAAESLYAGFDPASKKYRAMKPEETAWLGTKLAEVSASGLPVLVIDYLPPSGMAAAPALAARIRAAGFVPYISDIDLLGEGSTGLAPVKRRVLLVAGNTNDIFFSPLHLMAQLPLEYLGYDPLILTEAQVVASRPDPAAFAGVVVWLEYSKADNPEAFRAWAMDGIGKGTRFLFINSFGFDASPSSLAGLGLETEPDNSLSLAPPALKLNSPMCGFEGAPRLSKEDFLIRVSSGAPLMTAETANGKTFHPAALTPWGGYAFYSSLISAPVGENLWTIDPFLFLPAALGLAELPAPDLTTENGRRIFFSHIDGDGFVEPAEWDPARISGEVIRDEFLKKYQLPFTVSVIEGEISARGAYPKEHARYETAAKSIFALPNVEPASHSFSHPFYWGITGNATLYEMHNLTIPGYVLNYRREIYGARDYVNSLLPPGIKTQLFHWTGNCLPDPEQVKLTREAGLLNINGGGSTAMNFVPWLSRMMPSFMERDGETQVYSPIQNENVFTEGWKHPFYRFIQVMETIKLTGEPRRLKPVNVYFHFFSGSKLSSVNALRKVYNWAAGLKTAPMKTTDWLRRAGDFKTTFLARDGRGAWEIRNAGFLRTLRAPASFGAPDLAASSGLAGFKREGGQIYLHLDGSGSASVLFSTAPVSQPAHIAESSALLVSFQRRWRGFTARLRAEAPGDVVLGGSGGCRILLDGALESGARLKLNKGEFTLDVDCK
ncbi:MAG TPA: hypothetical protein DCS63_00980 [Elusimicrobia bacterium]|nr:hypothetical protein [Elusimicrobiota bacterium]